MELHKKLIEKYKQYDMIFDDMNYLSILHDNNVLIRAKYLILGSYSSNKNIWLWADSSPTLDKTIIKNIQDFKNDISLKNIDKNLRNFVESRPQILESDNIMVNILPTHTLLDMIDMIGHIQNVNIINYSLSNNKTAFVVIEKIVFENLY